MPIDISKLTRKWKQVTFYRVRINGIFRFQRRWWVKKSEDNARAILKFRSNSITYGHLVLMTDKTARIMTFETEIKPSPNFLAKPDNPHLDIADKLLSKHFDLTKFLRTN